VDVIVLSSVCMLIPGSPFPGESRRVGAYCNGR
jgi:hypothetical protein